MAVIKGINGLEVTVEVDRVPATEYGPWDDEDTHPPGDMEFHIPKTGQLDGRPYVVKYIESKPGKTFRFRVKRAGEFRHRSHHIGYKFGIDAIVSGCIHDYTEDKRTPWDSTNGSIMSGDIKRGYTAFEACFAELDIESECSLPPEELKRQRTLVDNLGILRVFLYHMETGKSYAKPKSQPPPTHIGTIAEKSLKGKSLDTCVNFKAPRKLPPCRYYKSFYADSSRRPFAVFEFRYRSMDGLIKEGIIARPTARQQVQAMSDEEARRLAQQLLEEREAANLASPQPRVKAENRRDVKREYKEEDAMSDEAFLARYKGRRLASGAFQVDLTDD